MSDTTSTVEMESRPVSFSQLLLAKAAILILNVLIQSTRKDYG
jgi:hypothetical protein